MKKIIALFVCTILLVCAFSVCTFAEEEIVASVETTAGEVDTLSTTEENATEDEISGDKAMPDITPDIIVGWVKAHFEEISVVITLILTAIYNVRKHKLLNRSISATNSNAIAVAENSNITITQALNKMDEYSFSSAEEKKKLEATLNEAMAYIKAAKLANIEFANELAELLVLANIPNAKKDELYARHIAAVGAIADAETEVKTDDGGKEA